MMRRIAVVGDKLERGGEIRPYSGPVFTVGDAGHQVALIGGYAFCEACNSTGQITKAGGPRRIEFMGETAADGDIVSCNCPMSPRIVATLAGDSWCDDMAEITGIVASSQTIANSVSQIVKGTYDEQIQVTGRGASAGYPYVIETSDRRIYSGRLADDNRLPRIHTDAEDDYIIYWGDEALARKKGGE
jgi:hypothetical protein